MNRLYNGPLMGDPTSESEIITIGEPVVLTAAEAGEIAAGKGANVKEIVGQKLPEASTPAGKAAKASHIASANMNNVRLPYIMPENGSLETIATSMTIAGGAFRSVLESFIRNYPVKTLTKVVAGTADGAAKTITISTADCVAKALGFSFVATPIFFLKLSSKSDSVRAGGSITVKMSGTSLSGGVLAELEDKITREDANRAMNITYIPVIKAGDNMFPQQAIWGEDGGDDKDVTFTINGLFDGDTVELTAPGYDSVPLKNFLKKFSLNLL